MIYLASPYSHPDKKIVEQRMKVLLTIDAQLTADGFHVVSPLYKHFAAPYGNLPTDWEYWRGYCLELLRHCDKMVVIAYDGVVSVGVEAELDFCEKNGIPVEYVRV
jgi:hypothetical protein